MPGDAEHWSTAYIATYILIRYMMLGLAFHPRLRYTVVLKAQSVTRTHLNTVVSSVEDTPKPRRRALSPGRLRSEGLQR